MPRHVPAAPEWQNPIRPGVQSITLNLKTITPMFGGGYQPREVDADMPIRPAAIRGHLRFWWRALYGSRYATAEELFQAEEALWGSAEKAGSIAIRIPKAELGAEYTGYDTTSRSPRPEPVWAEWSKNKEGNWKKPPRVVQPWPSYALFAFFGEEPNRTARCQLGIAFKLTLAFDSSAPEEEVLQAAAAWVRFGGLGAGTRRGCGSIQCDELSDIRLSPLGANSHALTRLHGAVALLGNAKDNAVTAWNEAVNIYQKFRQGEDVARTHRTKKPAGADNSTPGRSWWPEADSIRRLTGCNARQHKPEHAVQKGFPRADLGLPIVFHFKDKKYGDPDDIVLSGLAPGKERLASPVITKAVADRKGYRPLVLVLNAPHAWEYGPIKLGHGAGGGARDFEIDREFIELSPAEQSRIRPLNGEPVREALIRYVERTWQVKREVLP
ncbi:MAG: type III-B CRISPR module RAMP protein Cmr1 [Chthonomonadales bacterium]